MDLNTVIHNSKNKENYRIENKTFEYSEIKDKAQFGEINECITFYDCIFKNKLIFENIDKNNLTIIFTKCTFKSIVEFSNCNFKEIVFYGIQEFQDIKMSGQYGSIRFTKDSLDNNPPKLKGNITINSKKLHQVFFAGFDLDGKISLCSNINNSFGVNFDSLSVKELDVINCSFCPKSDFREMQIKENANFYNCKFKRVYFDESYFESGSNFQFHNCSFKSE